jgi:DNA uptake protein ComE-like DNA-binding protein
MTLDTLLIVKVNLNRWTHAQLESHPYISKSLADFITTYRSRTPFQSITDLRKSFLVDTELYRKLRPYLTI